jgi:hypothetical protein
LECKDDLKAFEDHMPDMYALFRMAKKLNTIKEAEYIKNAYTM